MPKEASIWALLFTCIATETLCILAMLFAGIAALTGFDVAADQIFAFGVTSFKVTLSLFGLILLAVLVLAVAIGLSESEA